MNDITSAANWKMTVIGRMKISIQIPRPQEGIPSNELNNSLRTKAVPRGTSVNRN